MAEVAAIKAEVRNRVGKGGAREVRRQGQVPGIVYGNNEAPLAVAISMRDLNKERKHTGFMSRMLDLDIDGKKNRVLPREIQFDVVKDTPLHIDFIRISKTSKLIVAVPIVFANEEESAGLKRGGVLNVLVHELEIKCAADSIPETISIDVAGLDIHDTIHLSDIKLGKGVEAAHPERDNTIATLIAPSSVRSEAAKEEGGAAEEEQAAAGSEGKSE